MIHGKREMVTAQRNSLQDLMTLIYCQRLRAPSFRGCLCISRQRPKIVDCNDRPIKCKMSVIIHRFCRPSLKFDLVSRISQFATAYQIIAHCARIDLSSNEWRLMLAYWEIFGGGVAGNNAVGDLTHLISRHEIS